MPVNQGSRITLTAELRDQASAPVANLTRNVNRAADEVTEANRRQAAGANAAADVFEQAMDRAAGSTEVLERALSRAGIKQADALHRFDQASQSVTIAERRLEEVRSRTEAGSTARLTAERTLADARYRQTRALQAVTDATGELEDAQAAVLAQNEELANPPEQRTRQTRGEAFQTLSPAMAVAGGAMTLTYGKMLNTYADFDKAMSQVKAFTQETDSNMALLRESAMKYGADTAYSAAEAAGAINELGKAGVSTQDILAGGLEGALSLAAAGELDVSKAAEIAAATLVQFKLKGDQIPHLADLLVAGAGKAQGSVEDLGMALNQAGLVAAATGLNVEETTGTLAAFASNGLLGSDAGTSFKTMLQRLTPSSKEAAGEMERLGISAYDANGEFIGMANFAGVLKDGMKDLTDEQRMASMGIIFGSDAVRAANVLYEQGAEGIAKWTSEVNDAGYAAKTAGDLQDNLAGDLEKLGGSFDTVFLQSGSGANDVLRMMVQSAEDLVDWIGSLPTWLLQANAALVLVGGAALLSGAAIPKVLEMRRAILDLVSPSARATRAVNGFGKGLGIASAAVVGIMLAKTGIEAINDAIRSGKPAVEEYFNLLKTGGGDGLLKGLNFAGSDTEVGKYDRHDVEYGFVNVEEMERLKSLPHEVGVAQAAIEKLNSLKDGGFKRWADENLSFGNDWSAVDDALELEKAMKALSQSFTMEEAAVGQEALSSFAERMQLNDEQVAKLINSVPELKTALTNLATEKGIQLDPNDDLAVVDLALGRIGTSGAEAAAGLGNAAGAADALSNAAGPSAEEVEAMEKELADLGITLDGVVADMQKYLDFLFATGLAVMSSRDAQVGYQEALRGIDETVDDLIEKNGNLSGVLNKNKTDFDLTTEAGASANSAFQDLASGGMDRVKAMANEGLGQDQLQDKLSGTYDVLINAADAFGITGQAGVDLARKILGVPDGVNIDSWMSSEAKRVAEETQGAIDGIDSSVSINIKANPAPFYASLGAITNTPVMGAVGIALQHAQATANSGGGVYLDLPAAAGGAVVPGYAPGVDSEIMRVSPGEALLVPELVRAIGPSNIMTLNHIYSGGRPAGGGPARASLATVMDRLSPFTGMRAAAGGAVLTAPRIPDTVPAEWVRDQQKNAPENLTITAPAPRTNGSGINLESGAVQVRIDGTNLTEAQIQALVEAALTEALAKKQQEMEQSY